MTPIDAAILIQSPEPQVQSTLMLLRNAVTAEGCLTAATETQVQNSLYALRVTSPYSEAVASLEAAAAKLRMVAEAKREGRCNLYASRLIRLRKELCA